MKELSKEELWAKMLKAPETRASAVDSAGVALSKALYMKPEAPAATPESGPVACSPEAAHGAGFAENQIAAQGSANPSQEAVAAVAMVPATPQAPSKAAPSVPERASESKPGTARQAKATQPKDAAPRKLPFVEHEPAEHPVDPAALFDEITATILRYVVLDVEQAHGATLWVAHTHLTDVANVSPLAIINAPERACAKTLLQTLLGRMCCRALPAANASLSALFRAVEQWQPTLLIDEADTFFRQNTELHGMVNAGYQRGGYVLRSEATGDTFEPRMFSVYSAKSIAGIALERHLPDSTMSRGIVFNMRRKLPHESVERFRNADDSLFARLGSQLARFAQDYAAQIQLYQPVLPDALSDRAQDNWEPLLAIAACAGPLWLERANLAALKLSASSEALMSTGNELLADIKEVFDSEKVKNIRTVDLLKLLTGDEDKGWATYNRGKPMTPRQLAKQLDAYGIKSKTVRQGDDTPKGYEPEQFQDAFKRYLQATPPELSATAALTPKVAATPQPEGGMDCLDRYYVELLASQRGGVADTSESTGAAAADDDSRY